MEESSAMKISPIGNFVSRRFGSEDHPFPKAQRPRTIPIVNGFPRWPVSWNDLGIAFQEQQRHQLELLAGEVHEIVNDTCAVDIETFSVKRLSAMMYRQPYNPDILKLLFCTVQKALFEKPSFKGNARAINIAMGGFQVLDKGAYGKAYSITFRGEREIFVLKVPMTDDLQYLGSIHEFFVGLQLNRLRSPNFMRVYSAFKCFVNISGVIPNQKLCLDPGPKNIEKYFLLSEFVRGSPLYKVLYEANITDIMSIYLQILLALEEAWRVNKFTHYDLHTSNILVNELPGEMLIPYEIKGKLVYLKTRYIAKIIDYGMAYVEYNDESFGFIPAFHSRNEGHHPLDPNPIIDLYRLTGSIVYVLAFKARLAELQEFLPLAERFPSIYLAIRDHPRLIEMTAALDELAEKHWNYDTKDNEMAHDNLYVDAINFAMRYVDVAPTILLDHIPPGSRMYSCANGQCTDIENIKEILKSGVPTKRQKK